jgi:dihydrofolate reductase
MLSVIVAIARNGVIGREGNLPWRLPADLRRFKQVTMGGVLVMGRRTWESIGRPLPGRTSIVVTRQADYAVKYPEVVVVHDFESALKQATGLSTGRSEVYVIGGAEIYAAALPRAARIYVTWVDAEVSGDAHFPDWDCRGWELIWSEAHPADDRNQYGYVFHVYEKQTL